MEDSCSSPLSTAYFFRSSDGLVEGAGHPLDPGFLPRGHRDDPEVRPKDGPDRGGTEVLPQPRRPDPRVPVLRALDPDPAQLRERHHPPGGRRPRVLERRGDVRPEGGDARGPRTDGRTG